MRRTVTLATVGCLLIVAMLLLATACNSDIREKTEVLEVPLPDGRTVVCVMRDGQSEVSISCDWDGSRETATP